MRPRDSSRARLVTVVVATAFVAGSAAIPMRAKVVRVLGPAPAAAAADAPGQAVAGHAKRAARAATPLAVPTALTKAGLDLRSAPVAVPLRLRIPSLGVDATVLGVGITKQNVMDAPMGSPDDRVWQQAFWYRGSAVPGTASTALMAGHIDGGGHPAIFAHIADLKAGDAIIVHDTRTGLDVRFAVTRSVSYSLQQTRLPAVLRWMYGTGPVAGTTPQRSADGLSHLTLVTCSGTFRNGTHDHRLVVYATRVG